MSIECSECERDLRSGHARDCSRHHLNRSREARRCPNQPQGEECRRCGMMYQRAPECPRRFLPGVPT